MVWVLVKPDGQYHRAPDGLPLYYGSKREAAQAAKALGLKDFTIQPVRD
jgi:hypothetical protein